MTTALLVSRTFPYSAEWVHGIYQRLGTQVEALGRVVDQITCLFLLPTDQNCERDVEREHEDRLRRMWSPKVSLKLAPVLVDRVPETRWQRIGKGVFDFHAQLIARPTSEESAVRAVSAALLDVRPDIILAHRLTAMYPLMKIARSSPEKLYARPVMFDMDDVEHVALIRRLLRDPGWPAERLQLFQVPALLLAEARALRLASATLVCSEDDRRLLVRLSPKAVVVTVANSVRFPASDRVDASEPLVVFVGAMGYRPNAQAADSLVQEIWPKVRAVVPNAQLAIIGSGRERAASYPCADKSITFTGFVEDIGSWYRRARVVCCPVFHGGGTRVKVIEAAAYRKAVVSTRLGAEGLEFLPDHEIVLRDTPAEIAAACVQLLNDEAWASRLGQAALERARRIYDRRVVLAQLEELFRTGCGVSDCGRVMTGRPQKPVGRAQNL